MSDAPIRRTAFEWLAEQIVQHDDVLPWSVLTFSIQLDDTAVIDFEEIVSPAESTHGLVGEERRRYVTREFQFRVHQRSFRERVLRAY